MKPVSFSSLVLLAIAGILMAGTAVAQKQTNKKIYCWNQDGKRICGDALPAEAAGAAREEINARTGMTTAEIARQLTPEEALAKLQAEKVAKQALMNEQARARQARALHLSFASEQALIAFFEERQAKLDMDIKNAKSAIAPIRKSQVTRLERAADLELTGKPVPKKMHEGILAGHREIVAAKNRVTQLDQQKLELDTELQQALLLYRGEPGQGGEDPMNEDDPPINP